MQLDLQTNVAPMTLNIDCCAIVVEPPDQGIHALDTVAQALPRLRGLVV